METKVKLLRCEVAVAGLLKIEQIGSGVGVVLYSPSHKIAAGLHILAPQSGSHASDNPVMYADTAIPYAFELLSRKGAKAPLSVAIAGGAAMLIREGNSGGGRQRLLVEAVKEALGKLNLQVKIEETGGTKIRSITLDIDGGKIRVG